MRVYEYHSDKKRLHAHILANVHVPDVRETTKGRRYSKTISDQAAQSGMGYMTHAENLNNHLGAAKYITKYMTKDVGQMPRGIRRIQASRGFPKLPESEDAWQLSLGLTARDVADGIKRGYVWRDVQTDHIVTTDDFGEGVGIYPPLVVQ